MNTAKLHEAINKIAPLVSSSFGDLKDKSTWSFEYDGKPTVAQLSQVKAIIDAQPIFSAEQEQESVQNRIYLQATDWQVLRHLEEVAAGGKTSLSVAEFKDLSAKRLLARDSV